MKTDIHLYEGTEPFIFISYAHKDAQKAGPIIQWLHDNGYRIWFDKGIHSGEFATKIEERLEHSSCIVALLSDNYIESINCRNEISYAIKNQVTILPICLEPTQLRYGMNLQLVSYHFIYRYQLTESQFFKELGQSPEINKANMKTHNTGADASESGASRPSRKKAVALIACLGCILLVIGTWLIVSGLNTGDAASESQPNINNEHSHMTAYDEALMLQMTIQNWKPLAHREIDVTVEEVLSHHFDTVKYENNTVTAEKEGTSIAFSVYCRINADGSYAVDDYGDTIFYDCYINGSSVPPEKLEKYLCDLIIQMP